MKNVFCVIMILLLQLTVFAQFIGYDTAAAAAEVDVMTQNQYLGGDLTDVVIATDPASFNAALVAVLQQIAANDLPARVQKLADLITKRNPEVVGLQEVISITCANIIGDGCNDPSIAGAFNNHLDETLNALGETYVDTAIVKAFDTTSLQVAGLPPGVPLSINGSQVVVNFIDHDVILVRNDITAVPVTFPCAGTPFESLDGCNYQFVATVNTPAGPLEIDRGFVAVDLEVGGKDYRFVNTHLEVQEPSPGNPLSSVFQAAQAGELIQTLAFTTPPGISLIVVGDINSSPLDPIIPGPRPLPPPFNQGIIRPYLQFVASGYTDAWTLRPGDNPGFTCCQDADLLNVQSALAERIDMVFSIQQPGEVKKARVLGANTSDKTPPAGQGLWPSDHGSVAIELQFDDEEDE